MGSLARKATLRFTLSIFNILFGVIGTILVARYMGAEAIGTVAFVFSIVYLLAVFSDFGISTAHLKISNEDFDIGKCNGAYLAIKFLLVSLSIISVLIYTSISVSNIDYISTSEFKLILFIGLLVLIFEEYKKTLSTIFISNLEIAKGSIPKLFTQFALMISKGAVVFFSLGVVYLSGTYLISALIGAIVASSLFRGSKINKPDFNLIKKYLMVAIPIGIIGIANASIMNICNISLGYFVGEVEVGYFMVSRRLTGPVVIAIQSTSGIVFVSLAKLSYKKDNSAVNIFSNSFERHASILVLPSIIFVYLFSEEINVLLFGKEFISSANILSILIIAVYFRILAVTFSAQILASGYLKLGVLLSIFNLGFIIVLLLIFIPDSFWGYKMLGFGGEGVALVLMFYQIWRYIISRIFSYTVRGTEMQYTVFKHLFVIFISILFFSYLDSFFTLGPFLFLLNFPLIVILSWGLLYLISELKKEDLDLYYNSINIFKMKDYIKKELG